MKHRPSQNFLRFWFLDFIGGLMAAPALWVMKLLEGSLVAVIAAITPGM